MGSDTRYDDGEWLGWNGQDFEGTIDLGASQLINTVTTRFFNKPSDWVYMPEWVSISVSDNGTDFKEIVRRTDLQNDKDGVQALSFAMWAVHARYLRINAKCLNPIEKGKPGEGNPGWLFVDEVKVE
jgi:hexosaminidase